MLFYIYVRIKNHAFRSFELYFDMIQYKICLVTSDSKKGRWSVGWVDKHITFQKDILTSLKSIRKLLWNANFFPRSYKLYLQKKCMYQILFETVCFLSCLFKFGKHYVYRLPSIDRNNHKITLFHRIILGEEYQEEKCRIILRIGHLKNFSCQ